MVEVVRGFKLRLRVLTLMEFLPICWVVCSIADSNIGVPGFGVAIGEVDDTRVWVWLSADSWATWIVCVVFEFTDFDLFDVAEALFAWKYTCLESPNSIIGSAQDPKNRVAANSVFVNVIFIGFIISFLFSRTKYQKVVLMSFAFFRKLVFFFTEFRKFLWANWRHPWNKFSHAQFP